jgi:hypothetical protein
MRDYKNLPGVSLYNDAYRTQDRMLAEVCLMTGESRHAAVGSGIRQVDK